MGYEVTCRHLERHKHKLRSALSVRDKDRSFTIENMAFVMRSSSLVHPLLQTCPHTAPDSLEGSVIHPKSSS